MIREDLIDFVKELKELPEYERTQDDLYYWILYRLEEILELNND